jgi:hypothetical protein
MSDPVPAGMMRTNGGARITARPTIENTVIVSVTGIWMELTADESRAFRDLLHDAELRAARGDVIT